MKNMPNIFKFLLIFLISYLILSSLTYVKTARSAAIPIHNAFQQMTFNMFHPTIRTDFKTYDGPSEDYDYSVYIYSAREYRVALNKNAVKPHNISNQNARATAFGPFIMLIALIIASPITWKRKLLSLALGSFLIFILLSMKYTALFDANMDTLKPKSSIWIALSNLFGDAFRTHEFLAMTIAPIWAISSLRLKDWKWFLK